MKKRNILILLAIVILILEAIGLYIFLDNEYDNYFFWKKRDSVTIPANIELFVNGSHVKSVNRVGGSWSMDADNGYSVSISSLMMTSYEILKNEEPIFVNNVDEIKFALDKKHYNVYDYEFLDAEFYISEKYEGTKIENILITDDNITLNLTEINEGIYYCTLSVKFSSGTCVYCMKFEVKKL